jgi:hypothetical protein
MLTVAPAGSYAPVDGESRLGKGDVRHLSDAFPLKMVELFFTVPQQ